MKISEAFSGNYLKSADLAQAQVYVIASVEQETMPDGANKPVVRFQNENRGLVLNKVNGLTIAELFGDDTGGWSGHQIELFSTTTFFGGKQVPCLRVRQPQAQQPIVQAAPMPQPAGPATPPPAGPVQQPVAGQHQAPATPQPPVLAPTGDVVPFDA